MWSEAGGACPPVVSGAKVGERRYSPVVSLSRVSLAVPDRSSQAELSRHFCNDHRRTRRVQTSRLGKLFTEDQVQEEWNKEVSLTRAGFKFAGMPLRGTRRALGRGEVAAGQVYDPNTKLTGAFTVTGRRVLGQPRSKDGESVTRSKSRDEASEELGGSRWLGTNRKLGPTIRGAYTLTIPIQLFSILPPGFVAGFKALCASTLLPVAQHAPEMWDAFEALGLTDRYEGIIASVGYERIEEYVLETCTGKWDKPCARVDDKPDRAVDAADARQGRVNNPNRNRKCLLHPGADIKLILTQYVAIHPNRRPVFKVADPIRRCLRERPDTIRSIVANLVDDDDSGDALVDENEPIQPLQQLEADDYNAANGDPEPIDAGPNFRTNKPSDVISMLVSIYNSKDLFVKELQVLLAQRLLAITDVNFEKVEKETDYAKEFSTYKPDKKLRWLPHLGTAHLELQLEYRTTDVPPLEAAFIELFSDKSASIHYSPPLTNADVWTIDELIAGVGAVDRTAALKALITWIDLGVLKEDQENAFRLRRSRKCDLRAIQIFEVLLAPLSMHWIGDVFGAPRAGCDEEPGLVSLTCDFRSIYSAKFIMATRKSQPTVASFHESFILRVDVNLQILDHQNPCGGRIDQASRPCQGKWSELTVKLMGGNQRDIRSVSGGKDHKVSNYRRSLSF
ncbi:hypothetical protein DFH07DRAFT_986179 [Mycena maculata]|uniref:Anaphase-promoting complex subunit 2 n=1 Tax=Mycena maculata TaxID=230809 RepID=A0AAD7I824_9AGAR|nr:hypothetical protein DFH07DRAFT_986179 [Mycena maculata]